MALELEFLVKDGATVKIKELKKQLDSLSPVTKKADAGFMGINKSLLAIGGSALVASKALGGLKSITNSFIKLENAQIGVQKTTGLSVQEFNKLDKSLKTMSTTMAGLETESLYDIAEAAGQLGIQGTKNITEFTRVIAMVGLTTELSAKDSATAFAKLSNSLNEPIDKIETLASVANELSNTTSATVGDLLRFSQRLSGGAKTAGLMTAEIFGLSATMTDLAINFETGGTNINRVMLELISDSDKFANAMGINADKYANSVQDKPIAALQTLLKHLDNLNKTDSANFLEDIGFKGTEVKDVLLKLSSNTGLLTKNLKIANDEYKSGTSIMSEYEVASQGLEAQNKLLSNAIENASAKFGGELKPVILEVAGIITDFTVDLTENSDEILRNARTIGIVAGSIGTTVVAYKAYNKAVLLSAAYTATFGGALGGVNRAMIASAIASKGLAVAMKAIPFVAIAGTIALIADSLFDSAKASGELEKSLDGTGKKLSELTKAALEYRKVVLDEAYYDALVDKNEAIADAEVQRWHESDKEHKKDMVNKEEAIQKYQAIFKEYKSVNEALENYGKTIEKVNGMDGGADGGSGGSGGSKSLTKEELKAIQKQLELNERLNDTYIAITGSEYDAWANETSNKMIAMAESTSITTEELEKYHQKLLEIRETGLLEQRAEIQWDDSEESDAIDNSILEERNQLEKDWADLQQENYMSMLDSQISLVNSTNDWNTALGDTLNSVGDISNSFSKLYSDNLKSEKEQFKLKIKYEKDLEKYGSDPSKKLKLDKAYAKDSDKIKNNSFKNELAGYADLTSGVKGMLDEKTGAYRALEAIETGMHVARLTMGAIELASTISNATASAAASSVAITAKMGEAAANATASVTAAGSGDPYTAPARVAIMVGLMAAAMTMFGGSGGGGVAGSVTAPTPPRSEEYYNDARDLAEETNKPILAKFDRQIELLEEISGYGGTTIGFSLDQALAEYTAQSQLDIINASEQGQKTNISTWSAGWEQWHVDPLSANKARLEALAGDFVENIDAWIKIIATDETHRYASGIAIDEGSFSNASEFVDFLEYLKGNNLLDEFGYTQLEYENILSDFQNATNEFVTSILSDVNTLTDFADELKGSYDEMSGTTKYEDIALSKAYEDVNSLVGGSTLSDYIELQIRNIDALENSLSDADISLLLSSSVEDFQEQQELVARIQKDALVTLDSGVLEALNYKDSILLVSEAMVESAESLRDFQDNIESMINGIDNAINSIRGNTMTNEELSEEEIKRLNLTQRAFEASLAESDTDKAQELLSEITSLSTSISNSAFGDTSLLDQNLISNLEATKALISFEDEVINVNIVSSELTTPVSTDTYAPSVTVSNPTNDSERLDNLEAIMTQVLITNRNVYDILLRIEDGGLKTI